ncbi:RDD family protein [Acinetobacter sp. WZC-1]|uniref:RDD family protein n=1 Tax=Acinetobacter sp. WZC-1 TaxID=3459034 RepID=UPI00403D926F
MQIYLARNNQQAGPYTLDQINQMLASQQILLTDLTWHQGMAEWKPLGELTQGQLVYHPAGHSLPVHPTQNSTISRIEVSRTEKNELASFGSRILAKLIDLLLWLPAASIPSFFMNQQEVTQLADIQEKMQAASSSTQALQLQQQLISLIPIEAWQAMLVYVVIMLAVQAFLLAKSGQSLGKKLTGIRIVDADSGEKVSLTRVFLLRSLLFVVLNLIFMPFIAIVDHIFGLNSKRQTLHDKLARTRVIK